MVVGSFTLISDLGKKYVFNLNDDGTCVISYPCFGDEDERQMVEEDFKFIAERLIKVLQSV